MQTQIKVIETTYNGYYFRSRLEARWAVFFDAIGIKYEYEPEGFDLGAHGFYLPDFWLPTFCGGLYAEVKPLGGDFSKARAFTQVTHQSIWLCEGPPDHRAWTVLVAPLTTYNYATHQWEDLPPDKIEVSEQIGIPLSDQAEREDRMYWEPGYENADLSVDDEHLGDWFKQAVSISRGVRFERGEDHWWLRRKP